MSKLYSLSAFAFRNMLPDWLKVRLRPQLPALKRSLLLRQTTEHLDREYFNRPRSLILPLLRETGETHNFTYDLTDRNLDYLAQMIALATGKPLAEVVGYIEEVRMDADLIALARSSHVGSRANLTCPFGRRMGWYAIARATKPKVIVETGVERGHGAIVLCAALLRNGQEGCAGRYYGTDINPAAGELLRGKYASTGRILYGDSIQSLASLSEVVDLFVNDSDHSGEYEYDEYLTVERNLADHAIILGDNAHISSSLSRFSRERGRPFMFFREEPRNHWYTGAGIGISLPPR